MGDVEWTGEAAAAVSRTILLGDGVARDLADYVVEPRTDAVLDALTPHVEAMVREARAEGYQQAITEMANYHRPRRDEPNRICTEAEAAEHRRLMAEEVCRGE